MKPFLAAVMLAMLPAQAPARSVEIVNAEDLLPVPGGRWIIASSMAGGAATSGRIVAVDTKTGRLVPLYPGTRKDGEATTPDCREEVASSDFKPHGVSLATAPDGRLRLYVVNHGARESVEMFVLLPGQAPRLRWIGCARAPAGLFANSVAALADGRLFVTNMGRPLDGSTPISAMGGEVAAWSPRGGWHSVPGSATVGPNGIIARPDGRTLYVASWGGKALVELKPGETGTTRRTLPLNLLPDNLRWSGRGTILVGGQSTSPGLVTECYTSTRTHCRIPSTIVEVDPVPLTVRCARPAPIDMATVAVEVDRRVWVGTARGSRIEQLPGLACPPG